MQLMANKQNFFFSIMQITKSSIPFTIKCKRDYLIPFYKHNTLERILKDKNTEQRRKFTQ